MCDALIERLEAPVTVLDPDLLDLLTLTVWGVFLTFGAVMFLMVAPLLTAAFRWWRDA